MGLPNLHRSALLSLFRYSTDWRGDWSDQPSIVVMAEDDGCIGPLVETMTSRRLIEGRKRQKLKLLLQTRR